MKWIEALRSGKYKQGAGKLRVGDCYCCLGVACEVPGIEGRNSEDGYVYMGLVATAPRKVVELLGLVSEVGSARGSGTNLTRLNDHGVPFEEIANMLEAGDYFVNKVPEEMDRGSTEQQVQTGDGSIA